MLRVLNILLAVAVVATAVWLYELKYGVRARVADNNQLKRDIARAQQDITLLKAEWSHMVRPERVQKLAGRHLELERVGPTQIIAENDIAATIPERAVVESPHEGDDPIAGLLRLDQ